MRCSGVGGGGGVWAEWRLCCWCVQLRGGGCIGAALGLRGGCVEVAWRQRGDCVEEPRRDGDCVQLRGGGRGCVGGAQGVLVFCTCLQWCGGGGCGCCVRAVWTKL